MFLLVVDEESADCADKKDMTGELVLWDKPKLASRGLNYRIKLTYLNYFYEHWKVAILK